MSALTKVIQFRSLINTLNVKDLGRFTTCLMSQCGREAILAPFCNQFLETNLNNQNVEIINTAINIIRTILKSRSEANEEHQQISRCTEIKLDTIPLPLMGEIGSYLKQKDHASLSKANMTIYIGCNHPNTLQVLDLTNVANYSCIKFTKYRKVKHLKLGLSNFINLSLQKTDTILRNMTKLSLDGANDDDDINLASLSDQSSINFANINYLELTRYELIQDDTERLLKLMPSIQYLVLDDTNLNIDDADHDPDSIVNLLPNWEGDIEKEKKLYKHTHTNNMEVGVWKNTDNNQTSGGLTIRGRNCVVNGSKVSWLIPTSVSADPCTQIGCLYNNHGNFKPSH